MKRLVEQAACEEHGQFGTHCPHPYHSLIACSRPCPGGSSREVIVDYEAGAIEWIRVYETWPDEPLHIETAKAIAEGMKNGDAAEGWTDDQYWREHIDCVTAALDAALGGTS